MVRQIFEITKIAYIKQLVVFGVLWFASFGASAFQLSEQAEISILTCAPGNGAATVYGHSAIRVNDPLYNYDLVFNYGIYDFEAPNFVYRFVSGQTDYLLAAYKYETFVNSYRRGKRSVYEQVLNLTSVEKQKIFDFLNWNAKPENRVYRYNFFFDNCATRVRDVIVDNVEGGVSFQEETLSHKTLRRLVKDYHGKLLWVDFGVDFIVSHDSDREASFWEEMFLPDYLMKHFAVAVKEKDNTPLVKKQIVVYQAPANDFKAMKAIGPMVFFSVLTLCVLFFSYKQFKKKRMNTRLTGWVYGFNGFVGIVVLWFVLYSEHPAMSPNYNLLWALPVNLVFVLACFVKKWKSQLVYYHLVLSLWMILFLASALFIPQAFHPVYYLLVLMVLARSIPHSILLLRSQGA